MGVKATRQIGSVKTRLLQEIEFRKRGQREHLSQLLLLEWLIQLVVGAKLSARQFADFLKPEFVLVR